MSTLTSFLTVDASTQFAVSSVSQAFNLPGTPAGDTVVRLTNGGPNPIAVKIGATVTPNTGLVLLAGQTETIGTGGATQIAAVLLWNSPNNSTLAVTTGS